MQIYWLDQVCDGRLGMMARPKGGEWLAEEVVQLRRNSVSRLVTLLEREEMVELGLGKLASTCSTHGITWTHFPITDRGIPPSKIGFQALVLDLGAELNEGGRIVLHCRMGIGRTGILAAALCIHSGMNSGQVFPHLSKIRGLAVPDTSEQKEWVLNLIGK